MSYFYLIFNLVSFLYWKWFLLLFVDLGRHFLQPMIVNEKGAYFLEGGGNVNFLCLITNGGKHFLWITILDGGVFSVDNDYWWEALHVSDCWSSHCVYSVNSNCWQGEFSGVSDCWRCILSVCISYRQLLLVALAGSVVAANDCYWGLHFLLPMIFNKAIVFSVVSNCCWSRHHFLKTVIGGSMIFLVPVGEEGHFLLPVMVRVTFLVISEKFSQNW